MPETLVGGATYEEGQVNTKILCILRLTSKGIRSNALAVYAVGRSGILPDIAVGLALRVGRVRPTYHSRQRPGVGEGDSGGGAFPGRGIVQRG